MAAPDTAAGPGRRSKTRKSDRLPGGSAGSPFGAGSKDMVREPEEVALRTTASVLGGAKVRLGMPDLSVGRASGELVRYRGRVAIIALFPLGR